MSAMREVEWLPPLLDRHRAPDRFRRIKASAGRAGPAIDYLMASDWLPEAGASLNRMLFTRIHLDHELAELIGLTVSQEASCRYCFAATRTLLIMVGYPRERIRRLEQDLPVADLDERTRTAIEFARRLARCDPHPSAADVAALARVGIADDAYRELAGVVALWVFFNRVSTIAALPPETMEQIPDRWTLRLARPFLAPWLERSFRVRGRPESLPADMRVGACAGAVNALDGLPVAPVLRRAIDAMWGSEGLPRRTRGLMCVTIARALGCRTSEAEATALLADLDVDAGTVDSVLAHLDAPGLSDVERLLVRFARETVWYEPAPLQRQAIAVRDRVEERVFVEALATAAMANMLCRLHLALAAA